MITEVCKHCKGSGIITSSGFEEEVREEYVTHDDIFDTIIAVKTLSEDIQKLFFAVSEIKEKIKVLDISVFIQSQNCINRLKSTTKNQAKIPIAS